MNRTQKAGRREVLRGMLGGAAVTLGVPFLDCFLNANGSALAASGAALPSCFGTWFWSCGLNPSRWEPRVVGPKYDMAVELAALTSFKDRINVYSGMQAFLDGRPAGVHTTGPQIALTGGIPRGPATPSIDTLIADVIGTKTRFRSLEVNCCGSPSSLSQRGGSIVNPSEPSPLALYTRLFGPDFKDPNGGDFSPDPRLMVKRSVLSAVAEQRDALMKQVGAADRARLDQYFTSLRELENKLDVELQRPAPLSACAVPGKLEREATPGTVVDDALSNHKLFAEMIAHAIACGQTRVFNVIFAPPFSPLRRAGDSMTLHLYTHEEAIDPKLGYQPTAASILMQCVEGMRTLLTALDGIREGDGTVLDRCLVFFHTDHGYAKFHSLDNMPMMTAGSAAGRMKTGIHVQAKGDAITRVGLTMQQALGVPINSWGSDSNQTSRTIGEVLA